MSIFLARVLDFEFLFQNGQISVKTIHFRELLWFAVSFYYTIVTGKCLLFT